MEPSPDFHRALLTNALANGCDNVRAVEASVANEPCRLDFYLERPTNLGGTSAVRPRCVESQFTADAAPLSDLVTSEELACARLLKIDVEGCEEAAVHGLLPALPKLRDDVEIMIEVTPRLLTKQGRTIRRPYAGPDPRCAGPGRSPR